MKRRVLYSVLILLTALLLRTETKGSESEIFPADTLQEKPVVRVLQPPSYPYELLKKGITGRATIEIVIDTKGDVSEARIVEATQPEFGEAARKAVLHARFRPGKVNGKPVNVLLRVPINFDLKK